MNSMPSIIEIESAPVVLVKGKKCQIVTIKDLSYIVTQSRKKLRLNYQQQLSMAMSHETMTPLNSILQLAECVRAQLHAA